MGGLALALFIALFFLGGDYFGWEDPHGRVSLALGAAFIFGIILGFRIKD